MRLFNIFIFFLAIVALRINGFYFLEQRVVFIVSLLFSQKKAGSKCLHSMNKLIQTYPDKAVFYDQKTLRYEPKRHRPVTPRREQCRQYLRGE